MLPRAPAALGLLLLLLLPPPPPGEATKKPTPCKRCRELVDKFNQGMVDTAKKNFGGGNTAWEEKTLSKYEFSEVRLLEIVEGLCGSSDFECNQLVEEHEEHLEAWWLQLKKKYPDLFEWFCVKTLKVCCSPGTYGPDCLGTFFRGDPRVSCIIPAIPVVIPSVPRRVRAALQREWPLQWRRQQTGGRDLPVPPGLPGATVHRLHSRVLQRAEERHPQRLHRRAECSPYLPASSWRRTQRADSTGSSVLLCPHCSRGFVTCARAAVAQACSPGDGPGRTAGPRVPCWRPQHATGRRGQICPRSLGLRVWE
ncbi:protein disulfide isomerase CRELD2 isoform X4 [Camelus ferus]|uniref:Protein disulfide isomerase CRELD2 isoform X4 n=1 Tax=Camelus ferus TaxID=419612 RepID=A0A8B8U1H1_CAMFR|nr:protein disulfide isomerase CRELD2 isoform X4 [Camelus ferus]